MRGPLAKHCDVPPVHIGGYARASYASGGGGASRVPRIAGDVTAGSALVSCVLVSYAPCTEGRRFDLLWRG
jgi:hypothetical protein